jgi:poly-gamma-glutamate synthesis protein (capsule biosynthesis protein)
LKPGKRSRRVQGVGHVVGRWVVAVILAAAATSCGEVAGAGDWPNAGDRVDTSTSDAVALTTATTTSTVPVTTSTATTTTTTTTAPEPEFTGRVHEIDEAVAARMQYSWREGCPVPLTEMRLLELSHYDFAGQVRTGELVVNADQVDAMLEVFERLFELEYPIDQMRLVDEFDADDMLSMQANNTSAFNCRYVSGTTRWSEHAFGRAVDVNPLTNPYVQGNRVSPPEGAPYVNRTQDIPGLIRADDEVVRAFAAVGWSWGGYWNSSQDYQHFSATGR